MAAFSYTGNARIQWGHFASDSEHFIDYDAGRGTLRVYPLDSPSGSGPYPLAAWQEYIGTMKDHPAQHITFLHGSNRF